MCLVWKLGFVVQETSARREMWEALQLGGGREVRQPLKPQLERQSRWLDLRMSTRRSALSNST